MKYVFIDYETTGLDPGRHALLEVGALVLGERFEDTGIRYQSLIRPEMGAAAASDDVAMAMHRDSGLFEAALYCNLDARDVEVEILELLSPLAPGGLVLAGNSVHFDRRFMAIWMPKLDKLFGHRMLDVSALRLAIHFLTGSDPLTYAKKRCHRSVDDLDETVAELRHYAPRVN